MSSPRKPQLPPAEEPAGEQESDRSQTSAPPVVPLPEPRRMSEQEITERAEAARRKDPTAETGQAG